MEGVGCGPHQQALLDANRSMVADAGARALRVGGLGGAKDVLGIVAAKVFVVSKTPSAPELERPARTDDH